MAGISYNVPASGAAKNPTQNYIPVNLGLTNFSDSDLYNFSGQTMYPIPNGVIQGFFLDFPNKRISLGDFGPTDLALVIDSTNQVYNFTGDPTAIESSTAGGSSGNHLVIQVNGVTYKIKLENP